MSEGNQYSTKINQDDIVTELELKFHFFFIYMQLIQLEIHTDFFV